MLFSCSTTDNKNELDKLPQNTFGLSKDQSFGCFYSKDSTIFSMWSPFADQVKLKIYNQYKDEEPSVTIPLIKDQKGTWKTVIKEDLLHKFYTFQVQFKGEWLKETIGIYATACGINAEKAAIIDWNQTNPENWDKDPIYKKPLTFDQSKETNEEYPIIYEAHLRDLTISNESGISEKIKGTYLGLTPNNTTNQTGIKTSVNHMIELGITHLHLLPMADFSLLKEAEMEDSFNWGYMTDNFFIPEGGYSTNPEDPKTRIKEFKTMILKLHQNGIKVVMDIVFNHTGKTEESAFNLEYPKYYYRLDEQGNWSDGAACGNETASEKPMMRQMMVENLLFWMRNYHIDGFRFDLMGLHDIQTMNLIARTLKKENPHVLLYGEGWSAGSSPLIEEKRAVKHLAKRFPDIKVFNDDFRDAIKGSVFNHQESGWISGKSEYKDKQEIIIEGLKGSVNLWAAEAAQSINYFSCHDNHTLWDKINISLPNMEENEKIERAKLAFGLLLTAQGTPFIHAGSEFLRTKNGMENSYNLPDSINQIYWNRKEKYWDVYSYVQQMIQLRKKFPSLFNLKTKSDIDNQIKFYPSKDPFLIALEIKNDKYALFIVHNASHQISKIPLPDSPWIRLSSPKKGYYGPMGSGVYQENLEINGIGTYIFCQKY